MLDELRSCRAIADHELDDIGERCIECLEGPAQQRVRRPRRQRRLLRRLPHDRVPACERECCVPRPHRDGKVERGDDAAHAVRMPRLEHAMVGPLGRDGEAMQLTRQPDREVADVDHFLHFAQAFLQELARLEGDEQAERALRVAQRVAVQPDELAAARRRHGLPAQLRGLRACDRVVELRVARERHVGEHGAVDRRARHHARAGAKR